MKNIDRFSYGGIPNHVKKMMNRSQLEVLFGHLVIALYVKFHIHEKILLSFLMGEFLFM